MAQSNVEVLRITVPPQSERLTWTSLGDLPFSEAEQFEIIQRWCDQADRQKSYHKLRNLRLRNEALRGKALEAKLKEFAKAAGMTLEEYLEMEETNSAPPVE